MKSITVETARSDVAAAQALVSTLQASARSASTRRAYAHDWARFEQWARVRGVEALPASPETVAAYLATASQLTGQDGSPSYSPRTLSRWLASINKAHALAGHPKPGDDPYVSEMMAGLRRRPSRPIRRVSPVTLALLRQVLAAIDVSTYPHGVVGTRDAALLLLGFSGAFRRVEVASLRVGDITVDADDGLHIRVARSKTDQEGHGQVKGLPYGDSPLTCPPCAWRRWQSLLVPLLNGDRVAVLRSLAAADTGVHVCRDANTADTPGDAPVFPALTKSGVIARQSSISGQAVYDAVVRRLAAAGFDPSGYGAHSLRAGFVTQALRAGANHHEVMRQTGHAQPATVEIYSREHDPLAHNAVTRLGL